MVGFGKMVCLGRVAVLTSFGHAKRGVKMRCCCSSVLMLRRAVLPPQPGVWCGEQLWQVHTLHNISPFECRRCGQVESHAVSTDTDCVRWQENDLHARNTQPSWRVSRIHLYSAREARVCVAFRIVEPKKRLNDAIHNYP